jgi:hypothetical protein
MQQMSVNLRLDQHQVDEKHNEIMFNIFIAEAAAVFAHG